MLKRMNAEKKAGIPVERRSGFAVSVEKGKPANELDETDWEDFFQRICERLKTKYPTVYQHVFDD